MVASKAAEGMTLLDLVSMLVLLRTASRVRSLPLVLRNGGAVEMTYKAAARRLARRLVKTEVLLHLVSMVRWKTTAALAKAPPVARSEAEKHEKEPGK